jgi:hypothetical protein
VQIPFWCLVAVVTLGCSSSQSGDAGGGGSSGAGGGVAGTSTAGQNAGGAPSSGVAGSGGGSTSGGASGSGGAASSVGGSSGGASGNAGGGAGNGGVGGSGGAAPVGDPAIRWLGRVDPTATGARLDWPGTGFTARFNGTGAHVSLKTNADYFEVVVDGQTSVLSTMSGTHVYDLAKNLSAGDHTVTVWRRTEPNDGIVEVGAITLDGTLLAPPPLSSKRLEIVGDSISVGFGVECKTNGEAFTFATENNYLTYQALTARKLGAEVFTEAWSGIGMYRDVGGSTNADNQMPARFAYTIPSDTTTSWDFTRYTPTAVAILLGTNDFGANGDPGQPFIDTYVTFVKNLRTHYASARFFLIVSPMISGDNRALLTSHLNDVIGNRSAAGDKNITLIAFDPPAADAWACGHPNAATHAIMAGVLEAALTKDLGW